MFIKISFVVVFFAITAAIGIYCRKHASNVGDFVLGGRNVGPWLTAFAYGTSYFSAVIFVGYAGQFGWKFGIASTWIGLGNALIGALLAWLVLGRRTHLMSKHLGSATMPDFFERRFNSTPLKVAASLIIFVFLVPYTASLYNGLSRLFNMAFNIDYIYCVIGMAVLTGLYVIFGGYMATAINDFVQGIVMLVGIVAVIVAVLNTQGGFADAFDALSQIKESSTDAPGAFASLFGPEPLELFGVVILTSLGTWGLPQMVQKFYAIKSRDAIRRGTVISTVFCLVVAGGCYFLGGFGRLFVTPDELALNGYDSIIPKMIENLHPVLIGIVVILVLSASMSTLSSLVLTSSSTLTLDFIAQIAKKNLSEKKKLLCMKVFIVFFIAVSSAIAIIQNVYSLAFIAQLMGISWGALAGSFLAPMIYGLYSRKVTPAAVWTSLGCGCAIMVANLTVTFANQIGGYELIFISKYFTSPINAGMLAMLIGLVTVPIVSAFTPKMKAEEVEKIFSCYDKTVAVGDKSPTE